MTLRLRTTTGRAVFEFEADGMKASWELSGKDSGPELVVKLGKMLEFLRREKLAQPEPAPAPVYQLPAVPTPAWPTTPQFTGVPPVQPVPLQDSLAAMPSGWELYTEENTDD